MNGSLTISAHINEVPTTTAPIRTLETNSKHIFKQTSNNLESNDFNRKSINGVSPPTLRTSIYVNQNELVIISFKKVQKRYKIRRLLKFKKD